MKKSFFVTLAFVLSLVHLSAATVELKSVTIPLVGNTFQLKGAERESLNDNGIENWSQANSEFGIYFSSSAETTVKLSVTIDRQVDKSTLSVLLNKQKQNIVIEKGRSGKVEIGTFKLLKGYNTIYLKGIKKAGRDYAKVIAFIIDQNDDVQYSYIKDNENSRYYFGRRGPSVHLGYTMPKNVNVKWFYNELTVPVGSDPIGSYFMANGFGQGYFGMQVNSATERRILFSVWSSFSTDNPKDIPEDQRIVMLKKGENVHIGEFGNEGSGGQSYLKFNWEAGKTYSFLNSVEPDGNGKTVYTAYFKDLKSDKWILIARFSRPQTNTWYTGAHSFLENFEPNLGYKERRVLFNNQWVCTSDGVWSELCQARFTGDDIAQVKYRLDFEGGVDQNSFFLHNCGFFNSAVPIHSVFKRTPSDKKPIVDFNSLP